MLDGEKLRTKCSAIVRANMARADGDKAEAIRQYKIAAPLEEEEAEELASMERHDFIISLRSAVWCWFFAGDTERALWLAQVGLDLATTFGSDKEWPWEIAAIERAMRTVRRGKWPKLRID